MNVPLNISKCVYIIRLYQLVRHCRAAPIVEQKAPINTTQWLGQHRLAANNEPPWLWPNLYKRCKHKVNLLESIFIQKIISFLVQLTIFGHDYGAHVHWDLWSGTPLSIQYVVSLLETRRFIILNVHKGWYKFSMRDEFFSVHKSHVKRSGDEWWDNPSQMAKPYWKICILYGFPCEMDLSHYKFLNTTWVAYDEGGEKYISHGILYKMHFLVYFTLQGMLNTLRKVED